MAMVTVVGVREGWSVAVASGRQVKLVMSPRASERDIRRGLVHNLQTDLGSICDCSEWSDYEGS